LHLFSTDIMNIFNRSDATYPLNSSTATENPEGSSVHSKTAYQPKSWYWYSFELASNAIWATI